MGGLTEIIKGLQGLLADTSAFLNPLSTPVNLMVMGPAGYQFGDCRKLGLPLMLWVSSSPSSLFP
jgi:di/tricarboxylate transporter